MSDKVYSWLLRLYPSHFREAYGEEARQLFRDRARAEKGFLPAVRLWLDLLVDLAISVPREYRYGQPQVQAAARQRVEASPSFHVLEGEPPRFGALFLGAYSRWWLFMESRFCSATPENIVETGHLSPHGKLRLMRVRLRQDQRCRTLPPQRIREWLRPDSQSTPA